MMQPSSALLLVASLLAASSVNADGLYTKKSPVLQVTQKTYDQLIANSNYTSIVEFYAPWCGHCQNLKPAYEKAAKNLEGLAKVAAVNCDDDANKPLCGRMGVQGFPTLKIITPSKKPGKPKVEDYQGARSAKAIVDAVVDRIPNHVKRVTDKDLDQWLSEDKEAPKAILFTEKGTTSAPLKAVAIEFLGSIKVAQVRNKESNAVKKFDVKQFPTLVLVPGGDKEPIIYNGELKKQAIVEFLSQVAAPNPDPAPASTEAKSSKSTKSSKKPKSSTIINEEAENLKPTESPDPKVVPDGATESKPVQVPIQAPPIPVLPTAEALEAACLKPTSGTCVLALLPEAREADAEVPGPAKEALASLSEIAHKHALRKSKLFPFYSIPTINSGAKTLRAGLGLSEDQTSVEIIALNGRRGWWRRYDASESQDYGAVSVEAWIDAIRLGEGSKSKLPEGVIVEQKKEAENEADQEADKEKGDHDEL
ncbi:putative disulfide isomerase [Aspergillus novofumigatus IBT 16806]|uniref:protein disulfide-isomerase n=1 Tax=Aspergillus novofumigatus (strain IBT 16806) TaxID=1392255 RepID=A0A2I1CAU3_ASPN1|nr:putative disulfide isomerase [Aspergillus novofumigatus IBT 16806]PKX94744.1 putative disulfide isomerase [Aspergillus novofumigatus IBT 16806]